MAKKGNRWSEVKLRQAIGEAIYSRHLQNKPIDQEAIKARYLGRSPRNAHFIQSFVDSYWTQLEAKTNETEIPTSAHASSLALSPKTQSYSQTQAQYTPPPSIGPSYSATYLYTPTTPADRAGWEGDPSKPYVLESATNSDIGQTYSVRLQEFRDHLAGNNHQQYSNDNLPGPSLES